jgi:pyruvate,water dikinase
MGRIEPLLEVYGQITGKTFDESFDDLPFLAQGAETMQTRCVEMLYDLACIAQAQPVVIECLHNNNADRLACLRQQGAATAFLRGFDAFMGIYGSRTGPFAQGIDGDNPYLIALPWREAPAQVLDMIAKYLLSAVQGENASPHAVRLRALHEHEARINALCASTQDEALVVLFRKKLDYFRRDAACLDDHNHYIDQLSGGQYAQALIHAGRWLAKCGDLPHPYDIFFLHVDEIDEALCAPERSGFRKLLAGRKAQFERESALVTPRFIGMPDSQLPERPPTRVDATSTQEDAPMPKILHGQASSRGLARGRARVITHLTAIPEIEHGDVLVANDAGPTWVPLFPVLAGVVLNWSGPGDHAAITAREFGVPMVCGTINATQRIADGAWVTVDGNTGRVAWE